jgi:hypothetical protein
VAKSLPAAGMPATVTVSVCVPMKACIAEPSCAHEFHSLTDFGTSAPSIAPVFRTACVPDFW